MSTDIAMLRGGNSSETVTVELWSIGVFDESKNTKYTTDIMDLVRTELNLPPER